MSTDHISVEPMKAYLLGKLDSSQSDELEDRYFADRTVLLRLDQCERDLCDSYLEGKLSTEDRVFFEQKYLHVPELTRKLDEARLRRNRALPSRASRFFGWQTAFAAALVTILIAGSGVYFRSANRVPLRGPDPVESIAAPIAVIALTPGVAKGNGRSSNVVLPQRAGKMAFQLEIPGVDRLLGCLADIVIIEPDGHRTQVWKSSGVVPAKLTGGVRRVTLDVDSTLFHHADYIATLRHPGGDVIETYLFRVSAH